MRGFRSVQVSHGVRQQARHAWALLCWFAWLAASGFGLIYGYFVEFDLGRGCMGLVAAKTEIAPAHGGRICTYFAPFTGVLLFWIASAAGFWALFPVSRRT